MKIQREETEQELQSSSSVVVFADRRRRKAMDAEDRGPHRMVNSMV